jgi:DNA polymerase III epsilon subunit family exonuclease
VVSDAAISTGSIRHRSEVTAPLAYATFDCETTGTSPSSDEIVSVAVVRLGADGIETLRYSSLVRPAGPIPADATAVHGISDEDVAGAPSFGEVAGVLVRMLIGAVFTAHNVEFDLPMLQRAFAEVGIHYHPASTACTLDAFRVLEPEAPEHRLESLCARHGIVLDGAHDALADALATAGLLRVLLERGLAPETAELDHSAFMRLRARGDTRPASEPQIRRIFGLARSAGLLAADGSVDRVRVLELVESVSGADDLDALTRAHVQDVFDALEALIAAEAA